MTRSVLVAALASLTLALASGAVHAAGVAKIGLDVDAGTLDPRLESDTSAYRVNDLLYDGLVELSPQMKPQPNLAVSWQNPDPTTWIFHLRDGVKFEDGTPLTAADVVYTYKSILDPKMNAPMRSLVQPIKSVTALDPETVNSL